MAPGTIPNKNDFMTGFIILNARTGEKTKPCKVNAVINQTIKTEVK